MKSSSGGFTLIELLVTVAIISILAAIAVPQFSEYRSRSFDARSLSDLTNAALGEELYFTDNQAYVDCTDAASCAGALPSFVGSAGVEIAMTVEPGVAGPNYFTGRSYHPDGVRHDIASSYRWDSSAGGLQP